METLVNFLGLVSQTKQSILIELAQALNRLGLQGICGLSMQIANNSQERGRGLAGRAQSFEMSSKVFSKLFALVGGLGHCKCNAQAARPSTGAGCAFLVPRSVLNLGGKGLDTANKPVLAPAEWHSLHHSVSTCICEVATRQTRHKFAERCGRKPHLCPGFDS